MSYHGHKSKYLKRQCRGLFEMWLHNTHCGRVRKGYGATPSRGCHKESLSGGHKNTGCPSHGASIWVKKDKGTESTTVLYFTVYEAQRRTEDSTRKTSTTYSEFDWHHLKRYTSSLSFHFFLCAVLWFMQTGYCTTSVNVDTPLSIDLLMCTYVSGDVFPSFGQAPWLQLS